MIVEATRALIQALKQKVTPNVSITTHTDMLELASLPALVLFTPDLQRVRLNDDSCETVVRNLATGSATIYPPAPTYDATFDLEVVSDSTIKVLDLGEKFNTWAERNPYLTVGDYSFPLMVLEPMGKAGSGSFPERDNIRRLRGRIVVQGIEVPPDEGDSGKLVRDLELGWRNENSGAFDNVKVEFKTKG